MRNDLACALDPGVRRDDTVLAMTGKIIVIPLIAGIQKHA
jgi:hypothetical protein